MTLTKYGNGYTLMDTKHTLAEAIHILGEELIIDDVSYTYPYLIEMYTVERLREIHNQLRSKLYNS